MRLFKYILFVGLSIGSLEATTLKEMIDFTLKNNQNLKALDLQTKSKLKDYDSVKNIFNPTLSVGANLLRLDGDKRAVQVGTTVSGFAKLSLNLYDGGKSIATKELKDYSYQVSILNEVTSTKEVIVDIVRLFFNTKTVLENIKVFKEKGTTLQAQYERVKTKYDLNMSTIDEVLKLKSEYESNLYTIQSLEYQKEELLETLSLVSGEEITVLDNSNLPEVLDLNYNKSENIKALELGLKIESKNKEIVLSKKSLQVKLEDTYSLYSYDDYNQKLLSDLPEQQNQLLLNLSFNLFDTSSSHRAEAIELSKLSLNQKLAYTQKNEKMKFSLAKKKLKIQKMKIASLGSAVNMGNTLYDMVKIKYQNGIVDNIAYLDALSKKIYNQALYAQALNDYEIAKAEYYLSSGVDYHEMLKEF